MMKTVNGMGIVAGVLFTVVVTASCAVSMVAFGEEAGAPILKAPADGATITGDYVTFEWYLVEGYGYYDIQVAVDDTFSMLELDDSDYDSTYTWGYVLPQDGTKFYWRVRCGGTANPWSQTRWFISALPQEGEENSEGEAGTLNPPILKSAPEDGATLEDTGSVRLEVSWYLIDTYYERVFYQVARDEAFTMLLQENTTNNEGFSYSCSEDGTYYWRIRRENDDGAHSDWITRSFTAKILEQVYPPNKLIIYVTPENSGEVIADPKMPSEGYPYETSVTLTAIAKQGYKFVQWDRSDDPKPQTSSTIRFTITSDRTVSAVFEGTQQGVEGEDTEGEQETPETTAAEVLQEHFSDADTDTDGLLTFEEALAVLDSLTQAQFNAFDTNNDSFLSQEELEAYLEPGSGCFSNCRKTKSTAEYVKRMIGDWLLMGLSLTVLLVMTKQ